MTTLTREWLRQTIAELEVARDDIPLGLGEDDAKILRRGLCVEQWQRYFHRQAWCTATRNRNNVINAAQLWPECGVR